MPLFAATLEVIDSTIIVFVEGEVDFAAAHCLAKYLDLALVADPDKVIVDLAETSFMDCCGLRVIAQAAEELPSGSDLVVRPSSTIHRADDQDHAARRELVNGEIVARRMPTHNGHAVRHQ